MLRSIGAIVCLVLVLGCVSEKPVVKQVGSDGNGKTSLVLPQLSKGKWAISLEDHSGTDKFRDCLDPSQLIMEKIDALGCKVTGMKQSNDTYIYTAQCKQLEGVEGKTGQVTFSISGGDSEFSLVSEIKGEKLDSRTEVHAQRVGECTPRRGTRLLCEEADRVRCSDCKTVTVKIPFDGQVRQEFCLSGPHSMFGPACEQHDYCYRHGWATYGLSREDCDHRFKRDMMRICDKKNWFLQWGGDQLCEAAATTFYQGVRLGGEDSFLKSTSSCCLFQEDGEDLIACVQCQEGGRSCGDSGGSSGGTGGSGHTAGRCCEEDYESGKCLLYVMPPHQCP